MGNQKMRKTVANLSFTEKVRILEKLRARSEQIAATPLRSKSENIAKPSRKHSK